MRLYYRLRLDRHAPGGAVTKRLLPEAFTEFAEARSDAVRLQHQLDAEGKPVTVYIVGADGVPCWRVGALDSEAEPEERARPEPQRPAVRRIA